MTSHLDSFGTTDIKPEMLSGVQTGNGTAHDKYNIRHWSCAHKQKRRHFHAKTTGAKLYIYIGVGAMDLYIDEPNIMFGYFFGFKICFDPKLCWFQNFVGTKFFFFWCQNFSDLKFCSDPKTFLDTFFYPNLFWPTFFQTQNFFWPQIYFGPKIFFGPKAFSDPKFFPTQNEL